MDQELSTWDTTSVTGCLKTTVETTDNTIAYLKEPTFTGLAGIWLKEETQSEPYFARQALELSFKAETGASALIGSISAAFVAIAAVTF
jgi:hypothetical protein